MQVINWKNTSIYHTKSYGVILHPLMFTENGYIKEIGTDKQSVCFDRDYAKAKLKQEFQHFFPLGKHNLLRLVEEVLNAN